MFGCPQVTRVVISMNTFIGFFFFNPRPPAFSLLFLAPFVMYPIKTYCFRPPARRETSVGLLVRSAVLEQALIAEVAFPRTLRGRTDHLAGPGLSRSWFLPLWRWPIQLSVCRSWPRTYLEERLRNEMRQVRVERHEEKTDPHTKLRALCKHDLQLLPMESRTITWMCTKQPCIQPPLPL